MIISEHTALAKKLIKNQENASNEKETYNHLTCRQMAAILLKVPSSGSKWLDDMILEQKRTESESSEKPTES